MVVPMSNIIMTERYQDKFSLFILRILLGFKADHLRKWKGGRKYFKTIISDKKQLLWLVSSINTVPD